MTELEQIELLLRQQYSKITAIADKTRDTDLSNALEQAAHDLDLICNQLARIHFP